MSFLAYKDIPDVAISEKDYLKTGITKFDKRCLGFGKGQLIIITGTRGGGKTSLLGQIKLNFVDNGYRGLEYNLEMIPKRAKQWVVLQACGKDNLKTRETSTGKTIYEPKSKYVADKVCEWLGEKLLIDDNESYRFTKIKENIEKKLNEDDKIDFIIVDNLFRMDIGDVANEKYLAQTKIAKELQLLCQKHNVCLILVCHPTKVKSCVRIEDVSGSGDLVNACDMCLIIHRVTNDFIARAKEYFNWKDDNEIFKFSTIFEVAKDREFGEEGTMIGLYYEDESKRFLNEIGENRHYGWENPLPQMKMVSSDEKDLIFD